MFNKKTIIVIFFAVTFISGTLLNPYFGYAESIKDLRNQSAKLQKEIDANNKQAEHLEQEGDTLKSAIASLDSQLYHATKEINLTDKKITLLGKQLKAAEIELARQKELLKANVLALYKRGDASTVEMIAGSDNFSQYIDEQEYLERLKSGIQDSTEKIVALTEEIQAQKKEQEELQNKQKSARKSLNNTRSQRARLLAQTEGQEAKYRKVAATLKKQQAAAEAALARALNSGSYRVAPVGPVERGGIVGSIGNTGLSSGPHLHLEVRSGSGTVNPSPYIKAQPINMPPGYVSQGYGASNSLYASGYHSGIDYATGSGSPIFAIDSGYMYRGCSNQMLGTSNNAYGFVAIVEHSSGVKSVYAHMSGGPSACNYNTYY